MEKYKNYLIGAGIGVVLYMWANGKLGRSRKKYRDREEVALNASGDESTRKVVIDVNKVEEVRDLQRRYPYEGNKKKPWWKCGDKCGGGVGGCVGKACVGPGGITIKF
jgi:hypothetical protein